MVREGLAEGPQQVLEAVPVGPGQGQLAGRGQLAEREPEQLVDQRVLAGEPAVHGADADPGAGRDLLHAGVRAGLAEHVPGRLQDALVVALGVDAHGQPSSGPAARASSDPAGAVSRPAVLSCRFAAGMSSPASAAKTSPAAITANPAV